MARAAAIPVLLAVVLAACGAAPDGEPEAAAPGLVPEPELTAAASAERAVLSQCGAVSPDGYCGVRIGMTPEAAAAAFPVKLQGYDGPSSADGEVAACYELFAAEPVTGIGLVVERNAVRRIDFLSQTARTTEGVGVGSTAESLRVTFGSALVEAPNLYEPEVTDARVVLGASKYVFEIQAGAVRAWRVGAPPLIDYATPCS